MSGLQEELRNARRDLTQLTKEADDAEMAAYAREKAREADRRVRKIQAKIADLANQS